MGDPPVDQESGAAVVPHPRQRIMQGGYATTSTRSIPKFANFGHADFTAGGYRVVPPAAARHGAFIGRNVI
jgi:2,3,4,5-tetrahydropyridine-2-carboxylate N-succinyltransferase